MERVSGRDVVAAAVLAVRDPRFDLTFASAGELDGHSGAVMVDTGDGRRSRTAIS